jgi:hypothetical protein
MKIRVSHINDPDMQAAPAALMRAAERARRLAEQTGTRFVVRTSGALLHDGLGRATATGPGSDGSASLPPSGSNVNHG